MSQPTTLVLDDLRLRGWRESDVPAVVAACQDREVARWIHLPEPFLEPHAREMLDDAAGLWRAGTGAAFAIVDATSDELLGAITRYGPEGHIATLGMWLAASARGRGVGTRALRLVIDWTFSVTDVTRIDCFIEVGNEPCLRMVDRVGFHREGLLRGWELGRDGRPIDCVAWSILRSDPRWDQPYMSEPGVVSN